MLEIDGLEKSFGATQAVRGLSLSLAKGDVLGFLGPNGAGKSTTMRMIAGVLGADAGDVRVAGHSIRDARTKAQAALGYLPEGAPLYDDMTPPDFLAFMARARGLKGRKLGDAVDQASADARISAIAGKRISQLSKGYRRRVGLAAAILHDPPVLILDEPMDGLDPNQKRAVRALINRMAPQKAILISTHTLEEVPILCNRLAIVDRGALVVEGTPDEVAARAPEGGLERVFRELTDRVDEVAP